MNSGMLAEVLASTSRSMPVAPPVTSTRCSSAASIFIAATLQEIPPRVGDLGDGVARDRLAVERDGLAPGIDDDRARAAVPDHVGGGQRAAVRDLRPLARRRQV